MMLTVMRCAYVWKKHKDACYSSFVNLTIDILYNIYDLTNFVHTEIWASVSPLGFLLILTEVVCFMHGA